MPALTLREIDRLLSPDLLEAPLPGEYPEGEALLDDEQTWRFEQARFIKEAITRAMHGPITVDELIDDYIVYYYETTPRGKRAGAIAAALDKGGIPNDYGMSWSEALANKDLSATVRSLFSMRYKRKTKPQS